ncbi:MAG: DNA polymerase III subunit delta' [Caulobacteraceae bacterium]
MNYSDIIGQNIIVESLTNAVKNNMVANGYIFSGPEGCGKKLMASVFAMALNCSSKDGEIPCNHCSSCLRVISGNHPNVDIVKPTGQTIKIKQIRQIISDVAKKPFESGYKIVILESAEKMTNDAQDAFLKTLEEPPQNTVFVLLSENYNLILPTIVSRCQVYQFNPVPVEAMKKYLQGKYDYPAADIDAAARYSGGTVGRALELLQDKSILQERNIFIEILDKTLIGSCNDALALASDSVGTKDSAEAFLNFCLEWFRDLMLFSDAQGADCKLLLNADKTSILSKHSSALTEGRLNSIMEIIKNTIRYVKHNVSIKNSIDGMLLNIAEVSLYNGKDNRSKI